MRLTKSKHLLKTAVTSGLLDRYYALCARFPFDTPLRTVPRAKDIVAAAKTKISLKKEAGVGPAAYHLIDLPAGLRLFFVVERYGSVVAHGQVKHGPLDECFSIHGLCKDGLDFFGLPPRDSGGPYKRPEPKTIDEVIEVFIEMRQLAIDFAIALNAPDDGTPKDYEMVEV